MPAPVKTMKCLLFRIRSARSCAFWAIKAGLSRRSVSGTFGAVLAIWSVGDGG